MNQNDKRLIQSALWLIRLRWLGVLGIIIVTLFSSNILKISVESFSIYVISVLFLMFNGIFFFHLKIHLRKEVQSQLFVKRLLNIQILTDYLILTTLLHYSGGIENPFIIYYIFHMIIGSIILSAKESFMQTSFALLLIGLLSIFEYSGIIPHFNLEGFVSHDLYKSKIYLIGTGLIFITTSYVVIYVTSLLASQAKRNEEAYLKANIELQKKDSLKNEYVLRLTHDINGSLGAIQNCLSVAVSKIHESDKKTLEEFINRAFERTNSLIEFVGDLLNLTKIKLNNKIQMDVFSIRESVKNVLKNTKATANEKDVEIITDIEEKVNEATGSQVSIEELISNLIMNAIKYSNKNSTVYLKIGELIDRLIIEVKDSGIGIPESEKKKIFNEFTRASNAERSNIKGTGIGLSIARQIVHNHGGEIWVESKEGTGSSFYFTIPK